MAKNISRSAVLVCALISIGVGCSDTKNASRTHAPDSQPGTTASPVHSQTIDGRTFRVLYAKRVQKEQQLIVAVHHDADPQQNHIWKSQTVITPIVDGQILSSSSVEVISEDSFRTESHTGRKHLILEWMVPYKPGDQLSRATTINFETDYRYSEEDAGLKFQNIPVTDL